MRSAVKIPLLASEQEAVILDSQSRIANWLYNELLERANDLRTQYRGRPDKEVGRALYTERGLRDLIPGINQPHPFLQTVSSSPLPNPPLPLSHAITPYPPP